MLFLHSRSLLFLLIKEEFVFLSGCENEFYVLVEVGQNSPQTHLIEILSIWFSKK